MKRFFTHMIFPFIGEIIHIGKQVVKNIFNFKDKVCDNKQVDETSNITDINKINEELKIAKNNFKREIEPLILQLSNQLFDVVLDSLNNLIPFSKKLGIENILSKTTQKLSYFLKNEINEQLELKLNLAFSFDNKEMMNILVLEPSPLKDTKFSNIKMKIYDEIKDYALKNIEDEILAAIEYLKSSKDIKCNLYEEKFAMLETDFNDILQNKTTIEEKNKNILKRLEFNKKLEDIIQNI